MKSKGSHPMKGISEKKMPSGGRIPKGHSRGPAAGPAAQSGRKGKQSSHGGMSNQKAKISQAGGKRKGPLAAIALEKAISAGKGGYK